MILCLDVGNTNIFGGVWKGDKIILRFRYASKNTHTSDQFGLFLRQVLRENECDPSLIKNIAICSVVPNLDYSLRAACRKYFSIDPFFLQVGVKTGLKVQTQNPQEVGADRIATAIAAVHFYPKKNIIVIDMGTATTLCAITSDRRYLGGSIVPGIKLAMESLQSGTAKLPTVEILAPKAAIGKNTIDSIQSGLYFSHLGAIRELCANFTKEAFHNEKPVIVATGGFAYLFQDASVCDIILPDLVLDGLRLALEMNV